MIKRLCTCALTAFFLCSCSAEGGVSMFPQGTEYYYDESAPVIEFEKTRMNADGVREYYLFDDNPEHLNPRFLADGEVPSLIAHFEDLTPGIYTVFSYHHRGDSVDYQADLYYDAVFSSSTGGEFEILNLGLDHDWDWNQAWADYTGETVYMPEYIRSYSCTCNEQLQGADGICTNPECPGIIRNQSREPNTALYDNLLTVKEVSPGSPVYLSDFVTHIEKDGVNHFRYGGYNEPMWMMMRFEVKSGTVTFDTLAYTDKTAAQNNFNTLLKGAFDNEPQYKGIAECAPVVTAELEYDINDSTSSGAIPVTVKNARVPEGFTIKDGVFATYVNTWREEQPIAAESDIMPLEYADDTKLQLYGAAAAGRDNIWRFDPYHTKTYGGYDAAWEKKLKEYGIAVGGDFEPNSSILEANYPKGTEVSTDEFYTYTACNLGNFGVTNVYKIRLCNSGTEERQFGLSIRSIAGQVYRYSQVDINSGAEIKSDGYIMKKFDDDPKEDPQSTSDPKARVKPPELGDDIIFGAEPGRTYEITIEITTLTGCVAPMHNNFFVN